ncbi:hypothetical protein JCM11641_005286 [Rhodosporidiobolus odoratus]
MPFNKTDNANVKLPLVRGRKEEKLTFFGGLHLAWTLSWQLFFFLPLRVILERGLLCLIHPIQRTLGRPLLADVLAKFTQWIFSRCSIPQVRFFCNNTNSYALTHAGPAFKGKRDWVKKVEVNGTAGWWIAEPGTDRTEDDVVVYHLHGGASTVDTGNTAHDFWMQALNDNQQKKGARFSIFTLDYRLAPEYKYPTQLIETVAGYHYLVNTLGISPSKILIAGDSFGGNLVTAFLLHLSRPAREVTVPSELGPTPEKPGAALLISPEANMGSLARSNTANALYDITTHGFVCRSAFDYVGARLPFTHRFRSRWVLNPIWQLADPQRVPPVPVDQLADYQGWTGWNKIEGVELFKSPYVNPVACKDPEWLKEAFPGDGKTLVSWGGAEILTDDCEAFYNDLQKAGVKPTKLFKEYGPHMWVILDRTVPTLWRTKSAGPDRHFEFGMNAVLGLLNKVAKDGAKIEDDKAKPVTDEATTTAREDKPKPASRKPAPAPEPVEPPKPGFSFAAAAASSDSISQDAPVVAEGEGKTLEAHLEDGKLVAEKQTKPRQDDEPKLPPIPTPAPTTDSSTTEPSVDVARPSAFDAAKEAQAAQEKEKEAKKSQSSKNKKKKAKKPVAPVPAPEDGGSYAAAASSKGVAEDAPVVAKGEGDVLKPHLDEGNLVNEASKGKAAAAPTASGGSWAAVAGSKADVDTDSPVVAVGEGDVLEAKLHDGAVHAEKQ